MWPDGGHVLRAVSGAQAAKVFVEDDVEHPVQAVLDVPVRADGVGEQGGVQGQGAEVEPPLAGGLAAALDLSLDHRDGLEARKAIGVHCTPIARETTTGLQEAHVVADRMTADLDPRRTPSFDAAMVRVGGVVPQQAGGARCAKGWVVEGALDLGVQVRPVLLGGEQVERRRSPEVVGLAVEHLLGDLGLAPSAGFPPGCA